MDLFRCAVCGISESDSSNQAQNSLQTNAVVGCGHQFCISCIDIELSRRKTFPCPICKTQVKRIKLTERSLDDVQCEKDTSWRKRITKVYNKVESDFPTSLEYNNYLEEVEDLIFCIVNEEPNAEQCKIKVKKHEEENKSAIAIRQSQRADEERLIIDRIDKEQREAERKKREFIQEERERKLMKMRYQKEATEVKLGERGKISKEALDSHLVGYKIDNKRRNGGSSGGVPGGGARVTVNVRVPHTGLFRDRKMDREFYLKRQSAGGGVPSNSIQSQERNLEMAVATLF
mmetsp:Transcript_3670/g.4316  ORF Transcript_3670/g.4316 Transcript_3670/m.4316 type:complete len:289 (-) Transcript_3670:59-925(-)